MTDLSATPEIPDKEPEMTENARRLTMAHEQALAEAVRVYGNLQAVSFGLSTEGRLIDEAMSIIAALVGENLSRTSERVPREELTK